MTMKPYYEHAGITIYHGDCREVLPSLEPVDLVVTSPPYANQRDYGFQNGEFVWDEVVPPALASVNLAADGQVLVNIGLVHKDGEVVCYWEPMIAAMRAVGHRLFGWYVWDQSFGLPGDGGGRFRPSHEWVFHFNRAPKDTIKFVPCKSAGRGTSGSTMRQKDGTTKALGCAGNAVIQPFKVPDSVIRVCREQARDISGHPAQYPAQFAEFLMRAWSGVVLDPFCGSGTTLEAAKSLGRRAIGIEIEERYCEIAAKRLAQDVLPLEVSA